MVSSVSIFSIAILVCSSICFITVAEMSMTGGFTSQNVNDTDIQEMVSRAMSKLNAESNSLNYLIPVEVLSAESQVVAGINYKIKVVVGKSTCFKNQVSAANFNAANCKESSENDRQTYTFQVWQKPWENFEQITFEQD